MAEKTGHAGEAPSAITLVRRLPCSPEEAWATVTQAAGIAAWWGDYVSLDARPGGAFREVWRDENGREIVTAGTVETVEPPYRLSLSWKDMDWPVETRVTVRIDTEGSETTLTLTHAGWDRFPGTEGAALKQAHEAGWNHHLDNLAALLRDRSSA